VLEKFDRIGLSESVDTNIGSDWVRLRRDESDVIGAQSVLLRGKYCVDMLIRSVY
jgi:hypothetical protein